jgi:hypothetical protein
MSAQRDVETRVRSEVATDTVFRGSLAKPMASPPLVLPGVLFVGEDERARVVAHLGPAAGWFVPRGTSSWSTEVTVVVREALTEDIRKGTKLVMPAEQIPPAKMPLTQKAAQSAPLVAVASKLGPKLVEAGVRMHTVGVDSVTSSFYYIAEGGGEETVRIEGDLVAAVAAMLGDRAETAAIERVLDGLTDRLLRALSRDRVTEIGLELAAALPRAAADGTGAQGIDLDGFEKKLSALIAQSERLSGQAKDIAEKLKETYERKVTVPLFGEARKVSMGPFDLTVGDKKVPLATYERWVMAGPMGEPAKAPSPSQPDNAAAGRAAAEKAAAEKVAAEKRAAEEAAAKKVAEAKAAAEKAAERAAAERRAAEEATAKKAAEAKAAAEKKAAEEKAAAERAAAEKKAAEERAAAEKRAAEEAATKRATEEKAAAEKKAAEDKAAAEKKVAEDKMPARGDGRNEKKAPEKSQSAIETVKVRRAADRSSSIMTWLAVVLLIAAGVLAWRVWFSH